MAIVNYTPLFKQSDILKLISARAATLEEILIDQMDQVGEQFIIDSRNGGEYRDRTGNLRASIAYCIAKDGKILRKNIVGGKREGRAAANQQLRAGSADQPGLTMVFVAGMFYAIYVESRGYDVITVSTLKAEKNFARSMERIRKLLRR